MVEQNLPESEKGKWRRRQGALAPIAILFHASDTRPAFRIRLMNFDSGTRSVGDGAETHLRWVLMAISGPRDYPFYEESLMRDTPS
jgi:hypothetical protein